MHVVDSLRLGGKERMVVELANASVQEGLEVSVCVTRSDVTRAEELLPEIPLCALDRRSTFDPQGFKRLAVFVREQRPDLIHVHGRYALPFMVLAKALRLVLAPILLHDHHGIGLNDSHPAWFRWWAKHKITHYVGVYEKLALWAQDTGIASEKISVIDNALDLSRIQQANPIDLKSEVQADDRLFGVFVGRISPEKGLDILIEAIARSKNGRKASYLVVGPATDESYMEECIARIHTLGLDDNFIFLGARIDVYRILKGVDFAILPSRTESGPLVLIEYMASELPFVATKVGGVSDQVAEMRVPGFVPPADALAFARELDGLLSLQSDARCERGKLGKEIAVRFSITESIKQWCELYERVLGYSTP